MWIKMISSPGAEPGTGKLQLSTDVTSVSEKPVYDHD